jgi:Fe-Mn family superoxide dismutase
MWGSLRLLSRIRVRNGLPEASAGRPLINLRCRSMHSSQRDNPATQTDVAGTQRALSSVAAAVAATAGSANANIPLPDLPYDYDALEPVISAEIMRLHHTKHHQGYVKNLNNALNTLHSTDHVPTLISLQPSLVFNGGGHLNHSILWTNLAPVGKGGGELPDKDSPLLKAIESDFGSLNNFMSLMNTAAAGIQGSGWAWLALNRNLRRLDIITRSNQDPVVGAYTPLLGIDVWEHAYYLQYKSDRAAYLKNIWQVIHWKDVMKRYEAAIA